MSDFLRLVTLQDFNTRVVLLGAGILGGACGVVGSFAVLRRRALMGDALAHAALPGVCFAYLVVGVRNLPAFLAGAFALGMVAIALVVLIRRHTRVKEDAAIALTLSVLFGLGVAMSSKIQRLSGGDKAGLDSFIFGKAAGMTLGDVQLLGAAALCSVLACGLLYKEFKLLCFDREFAGAIGRRVTLLDILLMSLVCLCTVAALPAVGAVLAVAMLTIPAAAARFWTDRLGLMVLIAGAIGAGAGVTGAAWSALVPRLSAGPVITLCAAALFIVSLAAAPRRGVVAAWLRRRGLRRRVARQNLLRALFEAEEAAGAAGPLPLREVAARRAWTPHQLLRLAQGAQRQGLVLMQPGIEPRLGLTAVGRSAAAQVVRAHRLWELFLIDQAHLASDHVDRDADQIEHVLPPTLLAELEQRLRAQGRLPYDGAAPRSPHRIDAKAGPSA